MSQIPSLGRIVHYRLSEHDVAEIDRESPRRTGGVGVQRNPVSVGQVYPAQVVATFGSGTTANLAVQLDGAAQHWATSRVEGDSPGTWCWPPRV
jgi:hypothetical protein